MFRCLFLYAVSAAPQEPEELIGKESLSAALTVSLVLMERSAMRLVRGVKTDLFVSDNLNNAMFEFLQSI